VARGLDSPKLEKRRTQRGVGRESNQYQQCGWEQQGGRRNCWFSTTEKMDPEDLKTGVTSSRKEATRRGRKKREGYAEWKKRKGTLDGKKIKKHTRKRGITAENRGKTMYKP